jgi:tRNA (guanine-N7-)-methyltransferase
MSPTRAAAFERLLPILGVEPSGPRIDPVDLFGRRAPLVLEIGTGAGEAVLAAATADPDIDHLAAEVHTPGLARLLVDVEAAGLGNVRVVHGDALEVLGRFAPGVFDEIRVWFPDPWPKVRQLQRRIISPDPVARLVTALTPGGRLRLATDVADYAEQMLAVCTAVDGLSGGAVPRPDDRPITRFERKGIEAGRTVTDLCFTRVDVPVPLAP